VTPTTAKVTTASNVLIGDNFIRRASILLSILPEHILPESGSESCVSWNMTGAQMQAGKTPVASAGGGGWRQTRNAIFLLQSSLHLV